MVSRVCGDVWKDDDNGIAVFVKSPNTPIPSVQMNDDQSLYHNCSTICPRNLQKSSSDPGDQTLDQTTFLLGHISQQLTVFSLNGTFTTTGVIPNILS